MAYRTDGTANFNFFINRQGPRGPQGIQGPEGFSPNVQVEEDHGNTFTLRVTNKDNFFITSNLREHKEDRGGDYIRYDRAGQLMYIGDPNFATTVKAGEVRLSTVDDLTAGSDTVALTPKVYKDDVTSRIEEVNQTINTLDANNVKVTRDQSIAGTKTFTDGIVTDRVSLSNGNSVLRPDAGRIKIGSTSNTAGTKLEGPYVEVRGTNVDIYGKLTAHGFADFNYNTTFYQDAIIKGSVKDDNNNLYLKQNTITAGDNVLIANTADGIKISSTGGVGDVTLAGDNSFTGNNTFGGVSTFNGDTWVNSLKVGTSLKNQQDKLFLNQSSITAGDNITIEETTDGVKISSTGGGGSAPENMVTTDTQQTITGSKTFTSDLVINANQAQSIAKLILGDRDGAQGAISANRTYGGIEIYGRERSSNTWARIASFSSSGVLSVAAGVSIDGKTAYHKGNLVAGTNVEFKKVNGVTSINSTGPTNEQIGQILESIADLSTKIDNLTTRLNNLEEVIDGGIA